MPTEECNRKIENFMNFKFFDKIKLEKELKECAQNICFLLDNIESAPFRKIREKYSKKECEEVAKFKIFI